MANTCHECQRPIEPGDQWFKVDNNWWQTTWFCSAACLLGYVCFIAGELPPQGFTTRRPR